MPGLRLQGLASRRGSRHSPCLQRVSFPFYRLPSLAVSFLVVLIFFFFLVCTGLTVQEVRQQLSDLMSLRATTVLGTLPLDLSLLEGTPPGVFSARLRVMMRELVEPCREYIWSVTDSVLVGDHEQHQADALTHSRELKAAEYAFCSISQDLRASEGQLAQLRLLLALRRPSEVVSWVADIISPQIVHLRRRIRDLVQLERESLILVGERRQAYGVAQSHLADFTRDVGIRRDEAERLYLQIGDLLSYPLGDLVS